MVEFTIYRDKETGEMWVHTTLKGEKPAVLSHGKAKPKKKPDENEDEQKKN